MRANLKVGKTIKALAYLTTPFAPWNPFAPWGVSPQALRLLTHSPLILVQPLQEVRGAATANNNILFRAWIELEFKACAEVLRDTVNSTY